MKATPDIRILVVEDDPFFQRVLMKRLAAEGYQVISDWMMPHVDGLELCQSVKTGLRDSSPYFILLTAKGEISDKLLALDTGADDYLVKPCDQGELLARVRAGLRIVLLTQDLRRSVRELAHVQQELKRMKQDLQRRGIGWPEAPGAGEKAA